MGVDRVSRAAAAAEQLCAVLWETLQERAQAGDAEQVGELSRRIAEVCDTLATLAGAAVEGGSPPESQRTPESRPTPVLRPTPEPRPASGLRPTSELRPTPEPRPASESRPTSELRPTPGLRSTSEPWPTPELRPVGGRTVTLVDEQADDGQAIADDCEAVEIKDARTGAHLPVTVAIQRRLERFADDAAPFTVLLVEVLDAERLRSLHASGEDLQELWAIESAIAEQLRPADTLLREIDGRWWLIAPDTDSFSAGELAERLAATARRFAHRGSPLRVVVGIAVCPEHGLDAAALIGHADVDLYAAQAAGRSVGGCFDGFNRFDGEDRPA